MQKCMQNLFAKIVHSALFCSRLSKIVSNVIDLYHRKDIVRGQTVLGKPDVSLNRVKLNFERIFYPPSLFTIL